ncbi:Hypothetical predicted protein [Lecanosticta acicola]|uniref:Uncharacterized protein n=1 Tax=Lecanosticta acicola TaxID=111012 RepID=A0AAI8Z923_9PEZI|nr:Hypothetical predicted protein [Lecanosticta acicola]
MSFNYGGQGGNPGSHNPWANEHSQEGHQEGGAKAEGYQEGEQNIRGYEEGQQNVKGYEDGYTAYQSGYKQSYDQQQQQQQPPRRNDTFAEDRFVPENERGEQREAMEEFEMKRSKPESQDERNVALLQDEFPSLDSSLVAAIYGDTQTLGSAREMLQELNSSSQSTRR